MHRIDKFYIGGEWVDPAPGGSFADIVNPTTEEVVGQLAQGQAVDVDRAVAAAQAAFPSWSATSREVRMQHLARLAELYEARAAELGAAICEDIGAPLWLARGRHVQLGISSFKTARSSLEKMEFVTRLGSTEVVGEPIGVAGLITPWNWPGASLAGRVSYALAAGCTMVLKPSELAPLSARVFAGILHEAGLPPGVFNMVQGTGPVAGAALSRHPGVDVLSLTGSTRAGIQIAIDAAPTVKRLQLELGGKSPNVILDDADLQAAVSDGIVNVMNNSGQTCVAPTRMLVPRHLHEQAVAIAVATANAMKVGDPKRDDSKVGAVAGRAQFEKVQRLIGVGIEEGARLVAGGLGRPAGIDKGYFVRPTVFANVHNDMTIAREEIFGPVLVIIPYDSEEDAVAIANDTPYGLAGYVWSGDAARARRVAGRLRAGTVRINGALPDPAAPFGGYKRSGNGREKGLHGIATYLEYKSIAT